MPPLAWLLTLADGVPSLTCGASVEVREGERQSWVEGCWTGAFNDFAFQQADEFFGSGGFVDRDGSITLVTPTHLLEAIYVLVTPGVVRASNSLPFLVGASGIDISTAFDLPATNNRIIAGLEKAPRVLFDAPRVRIERHVRAILSVGSDGVAFETRADDPPIADYAHYRRRLLSVMDRCLENAADPARRRRYTPLATVSSGYDSSSVAVLGRELGCREAITMSSGRFNLNDSGAPVAEALGMTCIERPRLSPEETSADMDAEFLAAFAPGDRYFAAFEGALAGRVLLTGHHGDAQWNISARDDAPYFRVGGGSGRGLREFRSRNDFFVMPVPMIGATRIEDVVRISNSAEMAPFGHGKAYDRPIPRRIGREGGIPDAAFGQRKAVASVAFWEGGFGPETVRRSDAFARRVVGPMARAKEAGARGVVRVLTWLLAAPADSPSRIQRLRYAIGRRAAGRISNRLNFRPHRAVMTLWAIETLATRYRDAMPAEEEVRDAA